MSQSLRKLIGTFVIVLLAIIYALVATAIAAAKLADSSGWVHLIYFLLTGFLWIVPAMIIIKWMARPDKNGQTEA